MSRVKIQRDFYSWSRGFLYCLFELVSLLDFREAAPLVPGAVVALEGALVLPFWGQLVLTLRITFQVNVLVLLLRLGYMLDLLSRVSRSVNTRLSLACNSLQTSSSTSVEI